LLISPGERARRPSLSDDGQGETRAAAGKNTSSLGRSLCNSGSQPLGRGRAAIMVGTLPLQQQPAFSTSKKNALNLVWHFYVVGTHTHKNGSWKNTFARHTAMWEVAHHTRISTAGISHGRHAEHTYKEKEELSTPFIYASLGWLGRHVAEGLRAQLHAHSTRTPPPWRCLTARAACHFHTTSHLTSPGQ